jgi:hypothetical protein
MLAHVKRIGTPLVTVAPFFHDFRYLTINHLFQALKTGLNCHPSLPLRKILYKLPGFTRFSVASGLQGQ